MKFFTDDKVFIAFSFYQILFFCNKATLNWANIADIYQQEIASIQRYASIRPIDPDAATSWCVKFS